MVQRVVAREESWEFAVSLPVIEASLAMDTRQAQRACAVSRIVCQAETVGYRANVLIAISSCSLSSSALQLFAASIILTHCPEHIRHREFRYPMLVIKEYA